MLHGAVDRFRFKLPAGFEVTDVRTPLLARWVVEKGGDDAAPVLDVTLREPTTETVVINVAAIRAQGSMEQWTMPRLEPLDVAGLLVGGHHDEAPHRRRHYRPTVNRSCTGDTPRSTP